MRASLLLLAILACGLAIDAHAQICGRVDGAAKPPTATDALAALKASIGTPGACRLCLCDVDGDGEVRASDALAILNKAVGIAASFQCAICTCPLPQRLPVGTHPRVVRAGDLDRDGNLDLVVAEDESRSVSILEGTGDGEFAERRAIDPGGAPMSVTLADLDGDQVLDLVTANLDPSTLAVLPGHGNGTFGQAKLLAAGDSPVNVAIGDINGDTRPDLLAVNSLSNDVSVYVQDDSGGFSARPRVAVGVGPRWIELGDLTGDGKQDAIVANRDSHSLSLLPGNGDGTFGDVKTIAVCAGAHQGIPADLNDDHALDLVVPCKADRVLAVVIAKGGGSFEQPRLYELQATAIAAAVADLQDDGKLDVVVTTWFPHLIVTFEGVGDGTLKETSRARTTPQPRGIELADINGDTLTDVVVAGTEANDVLVFRGTNNAALATKFEPVAFRPRARDMALGDFNGDGSLDFVSVNWHALSGIYTSYPPAELRFALRDVLDLPRFPSAVITGDFNGDHKIDFVAKNNKVWAEQPGKRCTDPHLAFFAGRGDFTFAPELRVAAANLSHHTDDDFVGTDVGGDGIDDLVIIERQSAAVTYMKGRTDGQFEVVQRIPVDVDAAHLAVGDFNADGAPDIAWVQGPDLRDLVIRLRDDFGRFGLAPNATARLGSAATWLATGDLDGDGRADVVTGVVGTNSVEARLAQADGTLSSPVRSNIEAQFLKAPDLVDADTDRVLDLVGLQRREVVDPFNPIGGPPIIVAGARDGRFGRAIVVDPGDLVPDLRASSSTAILPVHVDDDPAIDLVIADYSNRAIVNGTLLYNAGHCAEPVGAP